MMTLPEEITLVWHRKFTGATAIFILNRYSVLLTYLTLPFLDWIRWDENMVSAWFQFKIDSI